MKILYKQGNLFSSVLRESSQKQRVVAASGIFGSREAFGRWEQGLVGAKKGKSLF